MPFARVPPPPYTPPPSSRKRRRTFASRMSEGFPEYAQTVRTAGAVARAVVNPTPLNLVNAGVQAVNSYRTRATQTAKAAGRKRMRSQAIAGVSGGKFKLKQKKDIFAKYVNKGVVASKEIGTVLTGTVNTYPLYVGHATHGDNEFLQRNFFRCLVRELYEKSGVRISDLQTESPGTTTINMLYVIDDVNAAEAQISVATAGLSYQQVANGLYNDWQTVRNTAPAERNIFISQVYLATGAHTAAALLYKDLIVNILVKSDLKIQNRTLATGTDEDNNSTENISNQPLYGKMYQGKGNGLISKSFNQAVNTGKSLLAANNTGLIRLAPTAANLWFKDVPLASQFLPQPKMGKVSIEPGNVKTSSVVAVYRMKQTDFWNMLPSSAGVSSNLQNRYGKYRIFALEKALCVTATDSNPALGIELNCRMGMMFTRARKNAIAEVIEDQSFV